MCDGNHPCDIETLYRVSVCSYFIEEESHSGYMQKIDYVRTNDSHMNINESCNTYECVVSHK